MKKRRLVKVALIAIMALNASADEGPAETGLVGISRDHEMWIALDEAASNAAPRLAINTGLVLYELETVAITTNMLLATDADHGPAEIFFTIDPEGIGAVPRIGILSLAGVPMSAGEPFTVADLIAERVTFAAPITPSNLAFDDFAFRVTDAEGAVASDGTYTIFTFSIRIEDRNFAPVALDSMIQVRAGLTVTSQFEAVDINLPADPLTFSIVSNGTLGVATILDSSAGTFSYTPTITEPGIDQIVFQVFDGEVYSESNGVVTVQITYTSPLAVDFSIDVPLGGPVEFKIEAVDRNEPTGPITFSIVANGVWGIAVLLDPSTGVVSYTPTHVITVADTVQFQVYDGIGYAETNGVITLNLIKLAPEAEPATFQWAAGTSLTGKLEGSDPVEPALVFSLIDPADKGSVLLDAYTGAFTYEPLPGRFGHDTFSFAVVDSFAQTSTPATVSVFAALPGLWGDFVLMNGAWKSSKRFG